MRNLLHKYFDRTKVGRLDYFRQLLFLTFVPLSIFLFGFHLVGSYGLTIKPALACSACYILVASVALIAYLFQGPKKLKRIMPVCLVLLMVIQSVRLLVLASIGLHAPMLTTVNITVCYMIVLLCSISLLSRTSFVCTCINFSTIFLCRDLTHNPMYGQLLIIYGFMSVATTVFGFVAGTLLREQQMELDDYAHTIDQVLHVFNMNKTELLALLKLAKAKDADAVYDPELMEQLDHKTLRNIIKVANHIEHLQASRRKDMHERFPMLSPVELDVCRLVEQGRTLRDISNILGKSVSNVSTVRGNIRKKLGLAQDDDLRSALLDNK
mgnify:FL=1